MMNLKTFFLAALLLPNLISFAQPADLAQPYLVTTSDDTMMCSAIKLKEMAVTCQTASKKVEIRNEFIRRIYLPVNDSPYNGYFKTYAEKGEKRIYPYGPKTTGKVLAKGVFPRFFDMKPLDEEKDFWTRGLFEILAQNNGYKLCKIRNNNPSMSSFATTGETNLDKYILFEENEATGVVLTKSNFATEIIKLIEDCPKARQALKDPSVNHLKDVPGFLSLFAQCS